MTTGFHTTRRSQQPLPLVRARPALAMAMLLAALAVLSGCQTDKVTTSDNRPMPPTPRDAPATPTSAKANRMAFMVGSKPDDSDNNGYPDLIHITVALFAHPYPTSVRQSGAFIFTLYPSGQAGAAGVQPINSWRMEGKDLTPAMANAQYGPCYQFHLSLLANGTDRIALDRADMTCRFEPADGTPPVTCDGVRSIQIGRRMAAGK